MQRETDPGEDACGGALHALCAVARFHQVAADPSTLSHQLGLGKTDAIQLSDVLRAAQHLGLKARLTQTTIDRLPLTPLPALALMASDGGGSRAIILAQCDGQRVLVQDAADAGRPTIEPLEVFASRWTGRLILVASRASLTGELARFDFSWFIPAMVKYRRLLGEVMLISLMLQLFALVSPLFFQVVMDKVLVHKGLATLDVLVIGLVAVVVFESLLNALRSYVFSHTTSRIDVELGARLFRHLVHLPLAYFQARRVGDSVARVRELENIRNFLTGNALTVLLDVLFSVVFVAVMLVYSATLADGSVLPAWISFNASTRSFSGTPGNAGTLSLKVTAMDAAGASASQAFNLVISAVPGQILTGTKAADSLTGGAGDDRLDGAKGADQLRGLGGNDTYIVDNVHDVVIEADNEGFDRIESSVSYTAAANVEAISLTGTGNIDATGNALDNELVGNSGANKLDGGGGADLIEGGKGNDRLTGGLGADRYLFARGDGQDLIVDVDSTAGVQDVLKLGAGIAADQIWLRRVASNLEVSVIGTSDKVTISGWYADTSHHIEVLELSDGRRLLDSQVQNLVQAMAAFAPPPAGQLNLSSSYHDSLAPVIAANWQ